MLRSIFDFEYEFDSKDRVKTMKMLRREDNKTEIFNRFNELWENANLVHNEIAANEYLENKPFV